MTVPYWTRHRLYSRSHILPSHPAKARTVALREAAAVGVVVREHAAIDSVQKGDMMSEREGSDCAIFCHELFASMLASYIQHVIQAVRLRAGLDHFCGCDWQSILRVKQTLPVMTQSPSGNVQHFTVSVSCGAGQLMLVDGSSAEFDECLWCTQASPAAWVAKTGLPTGV